MSAPKFIKNTKAVSSTGIDFVVDPPPRPYLFEGVLAEKPTEWPEGANIIEAGYRARFSPVSGETVKYALKIISKKGRTVSFHLQNITAKSILDEINLKGEECCVGNRIEVYARYIYNMHGEVGLYAVWVVTRQRGEKKPPG